MSHVVVDEYGATYYYISRDSYILHREDGPAVIDPEGYSAWYINGKLHREDGPAATDADGYRCWRREGKYHRLDGPAVEMSSGHRRWFVNGRAVDQSMFPTAVAHWLSYKEITQEEIQNLIGNYRIVGWL